MKLGDRIIYNSGIAVYTGRIIGELEKEFVIFTDQLQQEGSEALWTYYRRIRKIEVERYLTVDPAAALVDL